MGPTLARALGLLRRPGVIVSFLLLAGGGSALVVLPLLGVPGYELSQALAIGVGLLGGAIGVASARQERRLIQGRDPRPRGALRSDSALASAFSAVSAALLLNLVGVAIPLGASIVYALRSTACDPFAQVLFVLLLPLPSAVIAAASGVLCGFTASRWFSGLLLHGLLLLGSLVATVWPILNGPQTFAFNHFLGWVPGPLYDEALHATGALWWFRLQTLLIALLFWCVVAFFLDMKTGEVTRPHFRPGSALLLGLLVAATAGIEERAPRLGTRMSDEHVRETLGGRRETAHFELIYPRGLDRDAVERFARDLEFRFSQLETFFGKTEQPKLKIYWYRSAEQKRQLTGAGATHFAKPWRHEFHTHGAAYPHPVLKHELAHVYAAAFGPGPFKVASVYGVVPHPGLIEGLAVAADDPADELTLHQWAAGMKKNQQLPDVRTMLSVKGFFSQSAQRAYTAAGSFLRWLADTNGAEKLRALHQSSDFDKTYGKSLSTLVGEWEAFLDTVELDEAAANQAFARFRQPALMGRACAREVASLVDEAADLSHSDPAKAAQLYERCSALQPEEPSHRIGAARALAAIDRLPDAAELLGKAAELYKDAPQVLAEVQMERADVAQKRNRPEEVKALLEAIAAAQVSAQMNRTAHVKLHALQTPAVADALWAYFGEGKDELKLLVLQKAVQESGADPFLNYLLGRRSAQAGASELARAYLDQALAGTLPESIHREALRLAIEAQFGAAMCDEVRRTVAAAASQPAAFRARAQEWVDRCAFEEATFQGPFKASGPLR